MCAPHATPCASHGTVRQACSPQPSPVRRAPGAGALPEAGFHWRATQQGACSPGPAWLGERPCTPPSEQGWCTAPRSKVCLRGICRQCSAMGEAQCYAGQDSRACLDDSAPEASGESWWQLDLTCCCSKLFRAHSLTAYLYPLPLGGATFNTRHVPVDVWYGRRSRQPPCFYKQQAVWATRIMISRGQVIRGKQTNPNLHPWTNKVRNRISRNFVRQSASSSLQGNGHGVSYNACPTRWHHFNIGTPSTGTRHSTMGMRKWLAR